MIAPTASLAEAEIDKLMGLHPKGFDLSLDRIRHLLEVLGNPQDRLPPVVHIAGTNGKGSATAFCRALLEAQGLAVHVHTSPHLVRWHERYRIGVRGGPSQLVDDERFADALRRVAAANGGGMITVFEILTAVTFLLFSEAPADAVILEVGLGGRFDATNVIDRPAVCVIQPISLDHQAYLGDRVELIAAEKAGIMKRAAPVVIGHQEFDSAREVLVSTAERLNCPVTVFGQDFLAYEEFGRLIYQDETGLMDLPLPRLPGRHQLGNAATAIRAVKAAGFTVTDSIAEQAMLNVEWPGRLQRLAHGNLVSIAPKGAEIWLDGGHNPGAGEVIAEAMAAMEERQSRPLHLIIGMINTKDPLGYFRAFSGIAQDVYTVPIEGSDVGLDPVALALSASDAGLTARPAGSLSEALRSIAETYAEDAVAPRIMFGGSLYLAGNVLAQNGTIPT
ncbi:bifunctional folylpolyglutamate synthase/dihydrofolate synthase [Peteryoungia desertarenae]|uniref:Bifunctional folylpolyglutamate synthase/dihydrofolate synthase n=1 Tax=Peteryoungia desertarenae TaxID=1813451 RepID=A0ABX6QJZ5_9HYPH|nr:folylpolyglutamate synthase/dihydrofolate synthase family protein [Peteryoungia desertarenae]QLF68876.1 bifunctional folylpolyglutamate synthase/dihydrofolate synthase [Peteryoungia desertarenae]